MPEVTRRPQDLRLVLLARWLHEELGMRGATIEPASEDASFRRYFRVRHGENCFVAMDAPPERESLQPFLRVAALLAGVGLNVPQVHEVDEARGFLLLSDLGSRHYLAELAAGADPEPLYADAAQALLILQTAAPVAELAPYDATRLRQEMGLFPEWFLGAHLGLPPAVERDALLERLGTVLVSVAHEQPQVFVHRDYHSRNLMLCPARNPGILDFQDAVRGALCYDLASLYKDCYIRWPRPRVLAWLESYRRQAEALGLPLPGQGEFRRWFDLIGLQRHLKVLGIFARLWYRDGKSGYLGDLPRVLDYVLEVSALYAETAELEAMLRGPVLSAFALAQQRVRA
jgi:aminoglycoside/choline kinase family phosphotransferase